MKHRKLGYRTIKTGIAVTLAALSCQILHLEYPFYAVIAAIISMDTSVDGSIKAGKNRMLGTMVGAILGVIMVCIDPSNAFLCGIGVMLLIMICNQLQWKGSIVIGGTVLAVILFNLNGRDPLWYSISRLLDTAVGILASLVVNRWLFPHSYDKVIKQRYDTLLQTMGQIPLNVSQVQKEYKAYLNVRKQTTKNDVLIEEMMVHCSCMQLDDIKSNPSIYAYHERQFRMLYQMLESEDIL